MPVYTISSPTSLLLRSAKKLKLNKTNRNIMTITFNEHTKQKFVWITYKTIIH